LPPLIRRRGDGGREAAVGRDTPKHVYGFIAGSLSDLLTRHGFEVREAVVTVAGDPLFDQLYVRNTNRGGVRGRV
jgi:hypothetical protein